MIRKPLFPWAAALALALVSPLGASGQDALAVLERAADRYVSFEAFCADFRQVVDNRILRRTIRSEGELCQARPDRFEMRFSDPAGDRVVADGEHLWVYLPSTDAGQVFQGGVGEAGGRFDLHAEFLSDPGERYEPSLDGREEVEGRPAWVLRLEPVETSPFLRARLWIDEADHLIRRAEITEDEGLVRTLHLDQIRLNPSISGTWFEFEPPAGAQVVRR